MINLHTPENASAIPIPPSAPCPSSIIETPGAKTRHSSLSELRDHYLYIGKVLRICEASVAKIGIPWLTPTSKVKSLKKEFYYPLDAFVRQSLSTIDTSSIRLYCEDLETPESSLKNNSLDMGIAVSSRSERHGMTVGVLLISTALFILVFAIFELGFKLSFTIACIIGLPGFALCALTTTDFYRRNTFLSLLNKELCRRDGISGSSGKGIGIMSIEPNA